MNIRVSQANRIGHLTTELGPDALVLQRFDGTDGVNSVFEYRVEAISLTPDVDLDAIVGTHATVKLETMANGPRFYDGIVVQAESVGVTEAGNLYRLTLRPWFWVASQRRNQRIFHEKTVVQIIEEVFADWAVFGAPVFENRLTGDYPVLEYTVQYRESDMNFVARLMERFGISYHFIHENGNHVLVMTDAMDGYDMIAGGSRDMTHSDGQHRREEEHFSTWSPGRGMTTGSVRLTDFNFKFPTAAMDADRTGDAAYANGQIEAFDWPGDYPDQGQGRKVAGLRVLQERMSDHRHSASGDVMSLGAGMRVIIDTAPLESVAGQEFLCLSARHVFTAEAYGSGQGGGTGDAYQGGYLFTPVTAPFAPARQTPVPVVHGPQTAMVVGEGEIDCDDYGRILVRFHWDLDNAYSMRCRVSQNWAGQGWGGMVIPRIGMEVVVEFLEGDPDKPLVTGCVYNGRNQVPDALPANKSKSIFRTDTHEGAGFNELSFEDQSEQEEIFMHAQKDHNVVVLNDQSHDIGHDRSKSVGNDQSESVGHDKTISVANNHTENVGNDVIYEVGRNQQERYGKDHIHNVGNIFKQAIYADHMYEVGRNFDGTVSGKFKLDVTERITNNTRKHTLMAYEKFVIKGPGGKIIIDSSGVTIDAISIKLKGAVSYGSGGSAQVATLRQAANEGLPLCEECLKNQQD